MPAWISSCQETMRCHIPGLQILSYAQFEALRTVDLDLDLMHLCPAHRADYIRCYLLRNYGGFWIDADCLVLRDLRSLIGCLDLYEFVGYRERQGHVANNFMGARAGSQVMEYFYKRVCSTLRSGEPLCWTEIGSKALTSTIRGLSTRWLQMNCELVQPICWSRPEAFFSVRSAEEHASLINPDSFCYMLSNVMIQKYQRRYRTCSLLKDGTFFTYLFEHSMYRSRPRSGYAGELSH